MAVEMRSRKTPLCCVHSVTSNGPVPINPSAHSFRTHFVEERSWRRLRFPSLEVGHVLQHSVPTESDPVEAHLVVVNDLDFGLTRLARSPPVSWMLSGWILGLASFHEKATSIGSHFAVSAVELHHLHGV